MIDPCSISQFFSINAFKGKKEKSQITVPTSLQFIAVISLQE